ncbi:MAG: tRNA (N6-isopentenyl adenosine(37)-C2)-methylthiotransferase MiaB, partial [Gemmatimonadetes bacterium]
YTREQYLDSVARLREAVPNLSLTTDVIVGFPGETEEDFGETLSAVREVGFADAFTFIFSLRDGTPATKLPPELTVPEDVAADRMARLIETVRGMSRARNLKSLGQRYEVLVEKGARRGDLVQARTRDFKTVLLPGDDAMIGRYYNVELTGTTGSTFTGTIVRERQPLPLAG